MYMHEDELKNFMLDSGLISRQDLEEAEERGKSQGMLFDEVLLSRGMLQENDLKRMHAHVVGIPYLSLESENPPFRILSYIPEPVSRLHSALAYGETDEGIEVALLDLRDIDSLSFVEEETGKRLLPRLTDTDSLRRGLLRYQKLLKKEFGDSLSRESHTFTTSRRRVRDPQYVAEDRAISRILDVLLRHAVSQHARDVHIEPRGEELSIRYRIGGVLHEAMALPKEILSGLQPRLQLLAGLSFTQGSAQEGRFKVHMNTKTLSVRISILPTAHGDKIVLRLLEEGSLGFTLEGLGFQGDNLERLHTAALSRQGMILAGGPAGGGVSTLLYTLLDMLNSPSKSLVTIEDPIEYQMKRVSQTEVQPENGLTHLSILRALNRQDPDVIMINSLDHTKVAQLALNSSLSGRLILSSLPLVHTRDIGSVLRNLDVDIPLFLSQTRAIVVTHLVPRLTSYTETFTLSTTELNELETYVDLEKVMKYLVQEGIYSKKKTWETVTFQHPKEGDKEKGYSGVVGVHEVLTLSPKVEQRIIEGASRDEIHKQASKEGMLTLTEDALVKAVQGITSIEAVFDLARTL